MNILKKGGGGSREKGEEETKSIPHAPVVTQCKFNKYQYELFHIWNECLKQDWCTFYSTFLS